MDPDTQKILQGELMPGEKLLWSGQPRQGLVFRKPDILIVPFSLLWGGFAIFWEYMALTMIPKAQSVPEGFATIFPLFGIPFVVIGLYMIFGRFIHDRIKRKNTYYGLTDGRAIIVSGIFGKNVKSLNLKSISHVSMSENDNGSGWISFGQENRPMNAFVVMGFTGTGGATAPKFELIDNVRQVYSKIREQQMS